MKYLKLTKTSVFVINNALIFFGILLFVFFSAKNVLSEQYNNELYEDYLALVNSKNELQARLDNLISEISFACPSIEFTDLDMASEQLFCTNGFIKPIEYSFDESIYSFSFNFAFGPGNG